MAESLALINLARHPAAAQGAINVALEHSRRSLELAREYDDAGLIATSKAEHRVRAVRSRPRGRGQAPRRRGARRLRAHGRDRGDRSRCSANTVITSNAPATTRVRWRSTTGSASSTMRSRAVAHQKSVLEIQEKYESEKRRREIETAQSAEGSQRGGAREPRAPRAHLVAARDDVRRIVPRDRRVLPQASRHQPAARAEEPGAQFPQQPRPPDRAVQPALFPGFHARRAATGPNAAHGHGRRVDRTRCC